MGNVIALDGILGLGDMASTRASTRAASPAGCAARSCGSATAPETLAPEVRDKIRNHPCYSEEAHHYFARMHVAVAPACNIQCHYCNRKYDCANESRPGVVSEKLSPEQAAQKVLAVAARVPQLSVVGIAGPGDALANPAATFRTFALIRDRLPDVRLCLSTNGLALPDHVQAIRDLGIDHVTITINMVDPEVGARIYPWIFFGHARRTGLEAARILHERQMQGLEMLVAAGVLVKVNSVMIPGINDDHLPEVNRQVTARGAFLHNIMPLISDPAHGTHFGLTGQRAPTGAELKALQDRCAGGGTRLMRHCRQCRADAVGMLGEDRGAEFTTDKVAAMPVDDDGEARRRYRAHVEAERAGRRQSRDAAAASVAGLAADPILIAVATKGGERINEHFGHAREFLVYEAGPAGVRFIGARRVDHYCEGGSGDGGKLEVILQAIGDCAAVLVAKIGTGPRRKLEARGIAAVDRFAFEYIDVSALIYFKDFASRRMHGTAAEETPDPRGDIAAPARRA